MKSCLTLLFVLLAGWIQAQSNPHGTAARVEPKPCNAQVTFCWYGPDAPIHDEIRAYGSGWAVQGQSVTSVEAVVEIRCVKSLGVCIRASSVIRKGKTEPDIDLFYVTSWEPSKVEAKAEGSGCEEVTLDLNRMEESATVISRPNSAANSQFCAQLKLKTVTYTLAQ